MKINLASASPRRKEILEMIGAEVSVCPNNACEHNEKNGGEYAEEAAKIKADAAKSEGIGGIVLAADTIVCIDGHILGKPKSRADAENMLRMLGGRSHMVYTGFCIIKDGKRVSGYEETEVVFRDISCDMLKWYLDTDEWCDKAGAYGIQGKGSLLVEKINGDFFNVMGLPVSRIFSEISKL